MIDVSTYRARIKVNPCQEKEPLEWPMDEWVRMFFENNSN